MIPSFCEQVQDSDKNTEIKYHEGDKVFLGYYDGSVVEFSLIENKIVYDFGICLDGYITSMAKTLDNKS